MGRVCTQAPMQPRVLAFYTLDKAVYELAYELNNRPDWASIPARALNKLLDV